MRILIVVLAVIIAACSSDKNAEWVKKDLMQYNVPIVILAPDSVDVVRNAYADQVDITVKGKNNYNIQLFERQKSNTDVAAIVSDLKSFVEDNPYFSEFISEKEDGFVYKLQIDSNNVKYGFRRVKTQGNKEYVIQPGMMNNYTLEEIEKLYTIYDLK